MFIFKFKFSNNKITYFYYVNYLLLNNIYLRLLRYFFSNSERVLSFVAVYKLSVPDGLLHFSELIIGDIILVICDDLPWLPLLEVEPDFLACLLQLMIACELWHELIFRRFRSSGHLHMLMKVNAVGAWSKVQYRCMIECAASESLEAGPRCLDIIISGHTG